MDNQLNIILSHEAISRQADAMIRVTTRVYYTQILYEDRYAFHLILISSIFRGKINSLNAPLFILIEGILYLFIECGEINGTNPKIISQNFVSL